MQKLVILALILALANCDYLTLAACGGGEGDKTTYQYDDSTSFCVDDACLEEFLRVQNIPTHGLANTDQNFQFDPSLKTTCVEMKTSVSSANTFTDGHDFTVDTIPAAYKDAGDVAIDVQVYVAGSNRMLYSFTQTYNLVTFDNMGHKTFTTNSASTPVYATGNSIQSIPTSVNTAVLETPVNEIQGPFSNDYSTPTTTFNYGETVYFKTAIIKTNALQDCNGTPALCTIELLNTGIEGTAAKYLNINSLFGTSHPAYAAPYNSLAITNLPPGAHKIQASATP